jgi:hypothetical protein
MPIRDVRSPITSDVRVTTDHPGPQSTTRAESPGSRSMPGARGRTDQTEGKPSAPTQPRSGDRPAELRD